MGTSHDSGQIRPDLIPSHDIGQVTAAAAEEKTFTMGPPPAWVTAEIAARRAYLQHGGGSKYPPQSGRVFLRASRHHCRAPLTDASMAPQLPHNITPAFASAEPVPQQQPVEPPTEIYRPNKVKNHLFCHITLVSEAGQPEKQIKIPIPIFAQLGIWEKEYNSQNKRTIHLLTPEQILDEKSRYAAGKYISIIANMNLGEHITAESKIQKQYAQAMGSLNETPCTSLEELEELEDKKAALQKSKELALQNLNEKYRQDAQARLQEVNERDLFRAFRTVFTPKQQQAQGAGFSHK